MQNKQRTFWQSFFAVTIAFIWAASYIIPSYADIAPPPSTQGYSILPGSEHIQVRMMYENVFMNIGMDGAPKVDANFVMRNLGDQPETMDVYFPLYFYQPDLTAETPCEQYGGNWGPQNNTIDDLAAWVWDQPQVVRIVRKQVTNHYKSSPYQPDLVTVSCWGVFQVTFPPGLNVPIEVKYTSPNYSYVLPTGAAWNGTIGQADITFRLPYDVIKGWNLYDCSPQSCTIQGRDIQWKFLDFEPNENLSISIVDPSTWWKVLISQNAIKLNPNDASAWGELALGYQRILKSEKGGGYGTDPANQEIYRQTLAAFQKAITLKPNEFRIRYYYADFICRKAIGDYRMDPTAEYGDFVECAKQLKTAYEIDSKGDYLNGLISSMAQFKINGVPMIDNVFNVFDQSPPIFTILTPTSALSSATPSPTPPPTQFVTLRVPTAMPTWTAIQSTIPTGTEIRSEIALLPTPTFINSTIAETNSSEHWGLILIPLALLIGFLILRKRRV